MSILVFGSANIDRTYFVDHFARGGETIAARLEEHCGGKGFNQAVAFARAGCEVHFAGAVGEDGGALIRMLAENGVNADLLLRESGPSGHAVIQVAPSGENCIVICAGANGRITRAYIDRVLGMFRAGDLIVLQNEIPEVPYLLKKAKLAGMVTAFNPSPFNETARECDLNDVDYLLVNETEGKELSGADRPEEIVSRIRAAYPEMNLILTLGERGSVCASRGGEISVCGRYGVKAVDTTGAGDTFTGFFLAEIVRTGSMREAQRLATVASGISVTRPGAAEAIPTVEEVREKLESFEATPVEK